jgi:hypothetical protein
MTAVYASNNLSQWLIVLCFLVGAYVPSSFGGVYSENLWRAQFALLAVFLLILLFRKNGAGGPGRFLNSLGLVAVILTATIASPFFDYRWGGLLGYLILALLFALNLRDVSARPYLRAAFLAVNIVNLAFGFAIVLGAEPVRAFFVNHYSAFYPELVEFMTRLGKPVLSFGTHSLAAFFFYLFFWLSFETFKARNTHGDLLFAIGYIVLGFALLSLSGLLLMSWATFQVLWHIARRRTKMVFAVLILFFVCSPFVYSRFATQIQDVEDTASFAGEIIASPTNGFLGRFSQLGTLYSTLNYIAEHPFRPVGVGYRNDLFFGDSGPVEYYLRGSIFLLAAVYGGLFLFLRKNLVSRRDAHHLFTVILLFELGLTALVNIRVLYLLPMLVVYLNDLRRFSVATSNGARMMHARSGSSLSNSC